MELTDDEILEEIFGPPDPNNKEMEMPVVEVCLWHGSCR